MDWVSVIGVYLPILWGIVVTILSLQVLRILYEHRFDFQVLDITIYPSFFYHVLFLFFSLIAASDAVLLSLDIVKIVLSFLYGFVLGVLL